MEKLILFFNQYIELNEEEISFLIHHASTIQVSKNKLLLKEGKVSKEFFFIIKGSVRMFYTSNLDEKTAFFYTENMFVSSYQSFTKQTPAKHNFITIEECELISFNANSVVNLINFSSKFEVLARIIMEDELAIYQDIISSFVTQNAEERYLTLLEEKPELIQRIPQHQIATFLGITPETLSRIRKRIAKK